ncbi:mannosyltransferase [Aureobasidium namibiae CBS 147.97]|uniref:GPI mannosyltransferase 2 n=1 Tax=Aureobasidium namibiae CBS 147.97 TaxID=1043004 RepID=A0A074X0M7_9PEZI|nr:mannosyltransferase [Aureobasidium namibiae CBS 147.97]KEQ75587.1 mannosyltransferase [Aureobasidium namibiae CBS 147.97]
MASPDRSSSSPLLADVRTLACLFVLWKLLLLCIAYASPGPGYDTSTTLLFARAQSALSENTLLEDFAKRLASKLVRWDALYFVSVAHRGRLFEQEWAWGWGYTNLLGLISKVLPRASSLSPLYVQAFAGVLISHVSHLLSVFMLYGLVHHLPIMNIPERRKVAFIAASLHIFSSAGLFLSAPYAESLFSMLNFLGILLHVGISYGMPLEKYGPSALIRLLLSGVCFGLATTCRSNGVFSGLIYFHHLYMLFHSKINVRTIVTVAVIGLSAIMILAGMLLPQYLAYQDFCVFSPADELRPWCSRSLPSVYSWVQEHYWNVGFLRYWTVSNIPLFLLAAPMLCALIGTGLAAPDLKIDVPGKRSKQASVYLLCLAAPQILLALLALTTFHVQIVNRIATGYPIWYIVIAAGISFVRHVQDHLGRPSSQQLIFRGMFMYSIIQGGLYASFMPPA